jgi:hypothetical protein
MARKTAGLDGVKYRLYRLSIDVDTDGPYIETGRKNA